MSEKKALTLNPGFRRRGASPCKCLLWTAIIFTAAIAILAAAVAAVQGYSFLHATRHPNRALYLKGTSLDTLTVRPLVGKEQSFDIAVSVWIRDEASQLEGPIAPDGIQYKPLFSDIVFTDIRLSEKNVHAKVNFTLPTSIFRAKSGLSELDLSGSFVLIPTSPSPLDYLRNYSHWIPESVHSQMPPRRSWPFPLGSTVNVEKTLADLAMEAFSVAVPLIEFHPVPSRCKDVDYTPALDMTREQMAKEAVDAAQLEEQNRHLEFLKSMLSRDGLGDFNKRHPHVVTRTMLRVVDETNAFDNELFSKAHQTLKSSSCGQWFGPGMPSFCDRYRSYSKTGVLEMKAELAVPTVDGFETQWAYAPYIDTSPHAAGPADYLPVPVHRVQCPIEMDVSDKPGYFDDVESVNVTWTVVYNAMSPLHDFEKMMAQTQAEGWNGLRGHRISENAHPRLKLFLEYSTYVMAFFIWPLNFFYWYSLTSTNGISFSATMLLIITETLDHLMDALESNWITDDSDFGDWILLGIWVICLATPMTLVYIKALFRVQIRWHEKWRWIPLMTIASASHRERASRRLDQRVGWITILGLLFVFTAFYVVVEPPTFFLMKPDVLPPTPSHPSSLRPALQVRLNHSQATFAGSYKLTCYLRIIILTFSTLWYFPSIMGTSAARGLELDSLLHAAFWAIPSWQALRLPSVLVDTEEEE
ncbi:hypothetical protein C8J56DRAFT_1167607 [Mycena floridula]|nr:hypothetical protein C8J56DRAFT_1167607 [Mycena floridula]